MRLSCLQLKLPDGRKGIELKGLLKLLLQLLILLLLLLLWRRRDTDGRYSVLVVGPGTVPIPVVIRRCHRSHLLRLDVALVHGRKGTNQQARPLSAPSPAEPSPRAVEGGSRLGEVVEDEEEEVAQADYREDPGGSLEPQCSFLTFNNEGHEAEADAHEEVDGRTEDVEDAPELET